jgi:truncated hemoglobin YjbI
MEKTDVSRVTSEEDRSLYERIGGSEAIAAAIDAFYERVLADPRVSHYLRRS